MQLNQNNTQYILSSRIGPFTEIRIGYPSFLHSARHKAHSVLGVIRFPYSTKTVLLYVPILRLLLIIKAEPSIHTHKLL